MIPWSSESQKFDFPELHADSVVVDCGAFNGAWAREIHKKYGCIILAFEPIKEFFDAACVLCQDYRRINLFNCALGGTFRYEEMGVSNDSSGLFSKAERRERVPVMPLVPHLRQVHSGKYALLKLNAEGSESEILEHILKEGAAPMFDAYLIQWHSVADPKWERRKAIYAGLSATHEMVWGDPEPNDNTWELWRSKHA